MHNNNFTIALRQLRKQKMYAVIKIGGFALGITACLLISLYIRDELNYDRSYPDTGRIFRLTNEFNDNGKIGMGASWPYPAAQALMTDFPEVEKAGRLMSSAGFDGAGSNEIRRADQLQNNYETGFTFADQGLLDILKIPMIAGDRNHALTQPNTMLISKRKADEYFPHQNPVGQLMVLGNDKNRTYKITGVMQDFPATSHIQYDFWLTLASHPLFPGEQTTWDAQNHYTYLLVKPGTDVAQQQGKLKLLLTKYYIPLLKSEGDVMADSLLQKARILLQPITQVHLDYAVDDGLTHGDIRFIWLFAAVAGFILLIACINFINLSTAKSANRAKEVGLRKVIGSLRSGLVRQFLTESMLFSLLSFAVAIGLAVLLLPYFNRLAGKSLTIPFTAWWLAPLLLGAAIVTGIFAGLYPSLYLSAFKPIDVLKGQIARGAKNSLLRNGLVVFQFTTSVILIISTLVVYNQMHYILNQKMGFDKDQVVMIQGTNTLGSEVKDFKHELAGLPQVSSVSISDYLPISGTKRNGNEFWREGKKKEEAGVGAESWMVDEDYIRTMGMRLVAGRNFAPNLTTDSLAVIINQTMAKRFHFTDPIGKRITPGWATYTIIGVVQDFNFESMRTNIEPLCLHPGISPSIISVKVNTADMKQTLAAITTLWRRFAPAQPIRYTFLDESFKNMYADVQRMGDIFTSFAVLAIMIACLGLFALSAFMAEQRNKEIGIRKVLGASVSGITLLMSREFILLVALAILIASPLAWWLMNTWLQDFAYRIAISWWIFAVAGAGAIVIALLTVASQSVKAALANPVKSLRSE
jgi:putative ABC transport system permease protein